MANKGNSDETEKLSGAMQQGTDSKSHLVPDTKMKSQSTSESEEKQNDDTEKLSGAMQQGTDSKSHLVPDTKMKSQSTSQSEEKQNDETEKLSGAMQQGTDLKSHLVPDTKMKSQSTSQSEEKQNDETEKLSGAMQQGADSKSHLVPDTKMKSQSTSQSEEKQNESPLNIQNPEEETAGDENEVQDQEQNLRPPTIVPGNNKTLWICAAVVMFAVIYAFMRSPDTTPPKTNDVVDVFNQEMEKLENSFRNQHPELWRRSRIHLRRHLKTKNPSEPVSLILTSGHRAEKTLDCLARCLARAFSTAVNSSVLNINGKSKASQDSDQVKLDIDRELRNAFEGEKSAAVIHRFEELPPGSTLIFYRYCDHENAAYKNVFLAFTVMLDAEVEVSSTVSLGRVEEMVQEHIKRKFVSSDKSAMFNQMDVDKLSGLWSRISHLILPVAAEEKIEQQGCGDCDKSF